MTVTAMTRISKDACRRISRDASLKSINKEHQQRSISEDTFRRTHLQRCIRNSRFVTLYRPWIKLHAILAAERAEGRELRGESWEELDTWRGVYTYDVFTRYTHSVLSSNRVCCVYYYIVRFNFGCDQKKSVGLRSGRYQLGSTCTQPDPSRSDSRLNTLNRCRRCNSKCNTHCMALCNALCNTHCNIHCNEHAHAHLQLGDVYTANHTHMHTLQHTLKDTLQHTHTHATATCSCSNEKRTSQPDQNL